MLNIILAHTDDWGIGNSAADGGHIPWNIPEDLKYFRRITSAVPSALIMGRKTADTLPKPLPGRECVVITRSESYRPGFTVANSLLGAIEYQIRQNRNIRLFVIGGAQIVTETLRYPGLIDQIYLTRIHGAYGTYRTDTHVTDLGQFVEENCTPVSSETHPTHTFGVYRTKRSDSAEHQYLRILTDLLRAEPRATRNSVTRSLFSTHMTFDLADGFPLLTTKRTYWKGIVNELLFFLAGCTDNQVLRNRDVHIWDLNTTAEFIKNSGLPYEPDTLGPVYGHQWRYFGAEYRGRGADYTDQGVDQFARVIDLLIRDPHSRRICMTTLNPAQVDEGVLPPCHGIVVQFYVQNGRINLQMYQRSADWFLGVPFNIASYALLLEIVVSLVNTMGGQSYRAGCVHMVFGDFHLYDNHFEQALRQLGRIPRTFPKLRMPKLDCLDPKYFLELNPNVFEIESYDPYPGIRADMVA